MSKKYARTTLADVMREGAILRELEPEFCRKAIEGYKDEIAPAHAAQEKFYKQVTCPNCGGNSFERRFLGMENGGRGVTWTDDAVPHALFHCLDCEIVFNPHSGIVVERAQGHIIPVDLHPGLTRK